MLKGAFVRVMRGMVDDAVNKVVEFIRKIHGVRKVRVLSDAERAALLQAELEGEKLIIGGQGLNEGLREALAREVVIACSTNKGFKWPKGPYAVLKIGDTVVGFITDDVDSIKKRCDEEVYVFGNNLILFPSRIRKIKDRERTTFFIYKGFSMKELEAGTGVKNATLAFCMRTGDAYLKKLLDEGEKAEIGTIIVGFDINKGKEQ